MTYVFLAGIDNSGTGHWQTLWHERFEGSVWVQHADWQYPDRDAWVADLDATLRSVEGEKLIVAHSLGCLLLAEWAQKHADPGIAGAFLVAPPDVEAPSFPAAITGFRPALENAMSCAALIVASEDDPYASLDYARRLAERWRARFVNAGCRGHINAASRLGDWPEGLQLLRDFESSLGATRDASRETSHAHGRTTSIPLAAGGEGEAAAGGEVHPNA
jgi:predicted alpha/beta hydrolase family esterase